ncbi:MAG: hypothetical protein KAS17_00645 [Victivallaceae bacterium]|nr:hypothetical protein [Victivallaceae bacterium]
MQKNKKQIQKENKKDDFFLDSRGLEVWQILKEIGDFYNVTVLAYDDIKNKKIHCCITGSDLKSTLNSIAWTCGVEFIEKDSVYYVGGNSQQVFVMDSAGIDPSIQLVFPKGQVRLVGDKLVIAGTESEVTKIKEAVNYITDRQFCVIHLYGIEVVYDKDLELGIEIEKSIQYFLDAKNFISTGFDPTTHIALSLVASVQAQSAFFDVSTLIDSDIGLISGNQAVLNIGEDIDRPLYSSSTFGDRVQQAYNTQHSGLIIKIKGFKAKDSWFFNTYIENSESKTELIKTLNSIENVVQIKGVNNKVLIARLNVGTVKKSYTHGIPYLADIPILGYCFRVTRERLLKKKIYFILEMRDSSKMVLPVPKQFNLPLIKSSNILYDSLDDKSEQKRKLKARKSKLIKK